MINNRKYTSVNLFMERQLPCIYLNMNSLALQNVRGNIKSKSKVSYNFESVGQLNYPTNN